MLSGLDRFPSVYGTGSTLLPSYQHRVTSGRVAAWAYLAQKNSCSLYTVYCALNTVYVHSLLYTVHSVLYTVHSVLYTVHSILYTVHSILYTVHSILYNTLGLLFADAEAALDLEPFATLAAHP